MPRNNPGEMPTKKIMAAATGETPKRRVIVRTKPALPTMPGVRFGQKSARKFPPTKSDASTDEIDDTTEE